MKQDVKMMERQKGNAHRYKPEIGYQVESNKVTMRKLRSSNEKSNKRKTTIHRKQATGHI